MDTLTLFALIGIPAYLLWLVKINISYRKELKKLTPEELKKEKEWENIYNSAW